MRRILLVFTVVAAVLGDRQQTKRSYACPPNFIRLSHRCYYFSKERATWQDAYFRCDSLHSNLAIIKNSNQDKLIKKTLSRKTLEPLDRWLGGRFDWQRRQWKWAASGKSLSYKGFDKSVNQDEENLQWSCIVMDPELQFRWNSRSCLEEKHFICHKRIQTITNNKSRKKLMQQYNTNKLNEIPIPDLPGDVRNLKAHQKIQSNPFHIEIYPMDVQPAYKERKIKKKKWLAAANGTLYENDPMVVRNGRNLRRRRNRVKEEESGLNHAPMHYKTYKEGGHRKHPLHPSPIVEEYNFAKGA